VAPPVTLPVANSGNPNGGRPQHAFQHHPNNNHSNKGNNRGPHGGDKNDGGGGGRRRRRRRPNGGGPSSGGGGRHTRNGREGGDRNRDRGPRLPGFYNPGGD
jgi:hypothetical protein